MFNWRDKIPYLGSTKTEDELLTEGFMRSEETAQDINTARPSTSQGSNEQDVDPIYVENDEVSHYFAKEIHQGQDFPGENPEALLSRTRAVAEDKDHELTEDSIDRVLECYDTKDEYIEAALENEDDSYRSRIDDAYPEIPSSQELGERRSDPE
ncbi:hypothetical protein [Candidatus Nanohalobium constans]|uniref:Uncharacterized protein n=1 Tax=Candidatus Nanohalobium constans TaxID=2565781 RepID=A0A5Q0UGT2_9ARCH|nr:hypothetical protein [Candidatus Nanohalobium constans]QGA80786.1 hypothetical protein LC1Nh_0903 [Candidatus Nanohalobium constans]